MPLVALVSRVKVSAVVVDVGRHQLALEDDVLVGRKGLVVGNRGVIHRVDGNRHRRNVGVHRAVVDLEGEAVRAVVVRVGSVGEGARGGIELHGTVGRRR